MNRENCKFMCLYIIRCCIEWLIEMSLDELSVSVVVDALVAYVLPIQAVSVGEDGAIFKYDFFKHFCCCCCYPTIISER